MVRSRLAFLSLASTALLAGCGGSAATPTTSAPIPPEQVEPLAASLVAVERYGPACDAIRSPLLTVLPRLVGLGKGTLLPVDVLLPLTTAQKDLAADAAEFPALSTEVSAVADDLGRIRVALATLKPADLGPLTAHLKKLAVDCGAG